MTALTTFRSSDQSSVTFTGSIFIDASYEGDLMAGVNVPYHVGREGRNEFNESLAGVSIGPDKGTADKRVMAYNYRLCLTSTPGNVALFPKPEQYDPSHGAKIYGPRIKSGKLTRMVELFWPDPSLKVGPNGKYDDNSTDLMGGSTDYPDGNWATRDAIISNQRNFILSKLYYLQNDPDLPPSWLAEARKWGFAADEFTDNDHFPFQLYVREARRMMGTYVLRQDDLTQHRYKPDGICDGSYGVDCHIVQRLTINGKSVADFTPHVTLNDYDIPYGCLTPKDHPDNLLVPVCVSATHVAYCSLRMEPVYMMLGHAAGDAAHLAISDRTSVQRVDVQKLRELLQSEHAVLDDGYVPQVTVKFAPQHPQPGQIVHFQAISGALKDPLTKIWWDFEGTGNVAATGPESSHTFSLDKKYHASLVAEDQTGRRCLVQLEVPVGAAAETDATVDDLDANRSGRWDPGFPSLPGQEGRGYSDVFLDAGISYDKTVHDEKRPVSALFAPSLPRAGRYLICFGYRPSPQAESKLPVTITCHGQQTKIIVDETKKESPFPFVSLGEFRCEKGMGCSLELDNSETTDRIGVDAVRWVWIGD